MEFISDITVECIDKMGNDASVARAAWVSTGVEWLEDPPSDRVRGVISYLIKHRHGTPFEHSAVTLRVHAPIFVWREWHRHRVGFSYNEESARYKKLDPVFYLPEPTRPMVKVDDWKPGRPKFMTLEEATAVGMPPSWQEAYRTLRDNLERSYRVSYQCYEQNLAMGFDPGVARACLPVGIYSACYVTCNPRSLMHFLSLRVGSEESLFRSYPLYEIQVAAEAAEKILKFHWPLTHEAFVQNRRVAP